MIDIFQIQGNLNTKMLVKILIYKRSLKGYIYILTDNNVIINNKNQKSFSQ